MINWSFSVAKAGPVNVPVGVPGVGDIAVVGVTGDGVRGGMTGEVREGCPVFGCVMVWAKAGIEHKQKAIAIHNIFICTSFSNCILLNK